MRRLRALGPRLAGTLLTGFLLLVFSTTLFAWWAVGPLRLQPLLVVVVSAGFRLPFVSGALTVFFLGYLSDVLSGGILGLQVTVYLLVFVVCSLAQRKLEINSWPFQMAAVGIMSLLVQVFLLGGLILAQRKYLAPPNLALAGVQALLNAFTAPLFFGALEGLVKFFKRLWPKEQRPVT
jgi:rod shape-determining protein MreD